MLRRARATWFDKLTTNGVGPLPPGDAYGHTEDEVVRIAEGLYESEAAQ